MCVQEARLGAVSANDSAAAHGIEPLWWLSSDIWSLQETERENSWKEAVPVKTEGLI